MDRISELEQKQSIAGAAIGFVRDALPFGKSQSDEERAAALQYREFLAEAMADTAAIIPRYGPITGGFVRAALLARPADSITENAKSFAGNFAEGAALKKIAHLAHPEGFLSTRSTQSTALLAQGFAFGAVKAGFHQDSWYREDGSFSIGRGAYQITSAGLFAGTLNVPLSFLGGRITGAILESSVASNLGAKSALVLGSTTSGYGTGFLMGSANAFLEGKQGTDILRAGNDSGLVSALTGATLMSFSPLRTSALEQPAARELVRIVKTHSELKSDNVVEPSAADFYRVPSLPREERLGLTRHRYTLRDEEIVNRSQDHKLVIEPQRVLKESLPLGSVPLFSDRAYLFRATKKEDWQQRVYVDADKRMGPLYVKHDYANELDAPFLPGSKVSPELRAPHHVEMMQAFLQTPDPSLIKRVDVRPDVNIYTLWHRRANRDPFMDISATAKSRTGEISMNLRGKSDKMVPVVDHEWSHLLEPKVTKERAIFEVAAALEKKGYYVSEYAKKDSGENWAEHSASFLGPNFGFLDFVHRAPLRAVALSQGMARAADNAARNSGIETDSGLANRIQYVEARIRPAAMHDLETRMGSHDQVEASRAALMYGALANDKQLAALHSESRSSEFLGAAAYSALIARLHNNQFQSRGYADIRVANAQSDLSKFLTSHLDPKNRSYSRYFALQGLLNQTSSSNLSPLLGSEHRELRRFWGDSLYLLLK